MAENSQFFWFKVILFNFVVFKFKVQGYSIPSTPTNAQTINLAGDSASSSYGQSGFDAANAIDDDISTCFETEPVKDTSWTVSLDKVRVIAGVGVAVEAGVPLKAADIYIGNDPGGGGELCTTGYPGSNPKYVACYHPIAGKFVTVKNTQSTGIKLCEFQIIECVDNYYGFNCSSQCHCLEDKSCNKMDGSCPSGCALGYHSDDCSQGCGNNTFGQDCAHQCHCTSNEQCDVITGSCAGGCDSNWEGEDCRTRVPWVTDKPVIESSDSNSITIKWLSWTKYVSDEFKVQYSVEYKELDTSIWLTGTDFEMQPGTHQIITINKLPFNTNYQFHVKASLTKTGDNGIEGEWGPNSLIYKTKCLAPQPPTLLEITPGTEMRDPPTAAFTVYWEEPPKAHIFCDSIAFYKILYAVKGSDVWEKTRAKTGSTSKRVFGLDFETEYSVMVVSVNNEHLDGRGVILYVTTLTAGDNGTVVVPKDDESRKKIMFLIAVLIAIILLAIIVAVICCVLRRKQKSNSNYATVPVKDADWSRNGDVTLHALTPLDKERSPTTDSGILVESAYKQTPSSSAESFTQLKYPRQPPKTPEAPPRKREHPDVNIVDLEDYVMQRRDNDCKEIKSEYKEFPEGGQFPWAHGKSRENKHKNRFVNIIAYDHSRVVLDVVEGDPDSDYINANYIDGYGKDRYYIAAQGCNKWTTQDMWRLAWQENSHRIVMVTNLVENGKRKCEQYWPEHMNTDKPYGEITVTWIDTEQTSDFVIRTFQLKKGEESRNLKQFHFTAWPDHGVPTRAAPIIAFRRKVRSFDESHPGTLITHCSAGVGRTGTYIAIDCLLEMAKVEKKVNLYNQTRKMRQQRVNMIQTEEQYVFVYDALLEALKTGDTAIQCSDFRMEFELLSRAAAATESDDTDGEQEEGLVQPHNAEPKTRLQKQFENLQSVSPRVTKEECASGSEADNMEKNRNQQILPADRHRPYLQTRVEGTNDYINAVFLDGYKSRNSHIITQMPLPHTVIDFWRMVHDHNVGSIVMLNSFNPQDETMGQYWPDEVACECGPFVIEPTGVKTDKIDVTVRELKLSFQPTQAGRKVGEMKSRTVNLFQYMAWPSDANVPQSKTSLMSLIDMIEKSQYRTGGGPVLIHCLDGASQSGLYAAISCIWEKMKLEQEVDIFHSVKHLRYHRPQVVQNMGQYKFCFEMVLAFLAEFETYANFTWTGNSESPADSD